MLRFQSENVWAHAMADWKRSQFRGQKKVPGLLIDWHWTNWSLVQKMCSLLKCISKCMMWEKHNNKIKNSWKYFSLSCWSSFAAISMFSEDLSVNELWVWQLLSLKYNILFSLWKKSKIIIHILEYKEKHNLFSKTESKSFLIPSLRVNHC